MLVRPAFVEIGARMAALAYRARLSTQIDPADTAHDEEPESAMHRPWAAARGLV